MYVYVYVRVMITYIPVVEEEAKERTRRAKEAIIKGEDCMLGAVAALLISRSLLLLLCVWCMYVRVECVCGWKAAQAEATATTSNNNHKHKHKGYPCSKGGRHLDQSTRLLKINVPV